MLTLTEAATLTKRTFVFLVIFIIVLIAAFVGVRAYLNSHKTSVAPTEEKPDLKYGLLPKPNLAESLTSSSSFNYTLNTTDGRLPRNFPKLIKVYFIPKLSTSLLASEKAKNLASKFNFNNGPNILTPTKYEFTGNINGHITVDLDNSNFKYVKEASSEAEKDENLPDKEKIEADFKNFLGEKELLKDGFDSGKMDVLFDKGNSQDSESAIVSIWQNDVDGLPVVTADFIHGLISATLNKARDEEQRYINLNYTFWDIDITNFATYPLKTVEAAFQELQSGRASVVIKPDSPQISIINVKLGYLLFDQYTPYLQPVYIFEGENDSFVALVSAIPDENLESQNSQTE